MYSSKVFRLPSRFINAQISYCFSIIGTSLRACSRGICTCKFCNSLKKSDSSYEVIPGSVNLWGYGGFWVIAVESASTGLSTLPELVVTGVTTLVGLVVIDVTVCSLSVVTGVTDASRSTVPPLEGSYSSSVMIGEWFGLIILPDRNWISLSPTGVIM